LEREEEEIMKEEEELRREEEEERMATKEAENMQSVHILNNNGTSIIENLLNDENKPNKYKHDYDTLPMPEKHFNWFDKKFKT
jgi:hypothetical protein